MAGSKRHHSRSHISKRQLAPTRAVCGDYHHHYLIAAIRYQHLRVTNVPSPDMTVKTLVRTCRSLPSARVRKLVANDLPHLLGCDRLFGGA
jgi:hypothetical protein